MKLLMFVAADYASIEATGKINVLGIFNNIYAREFPAKHSLLHLVVKLKPELGELEDRRTLKIEFADEDGKKLLLIAKDFQAPSRLNGETPEINVNLEVRDLELPHEGRYEFNLFIDGEKKGDLVLDARLLPQPLR